MNVLQRLRAFDTGIHRFVLRQYEHVLEVALNIWRFRGVSQRNGIQCIKRQENDTNSGQQNKSKRMHNPSHN